MTVREEFEAWQSQTHDKYGDWPLWQAAYAAGRKAAMGEREDYDLPMQIRQLQGQVESLKAQCGIAMIDGYRKGRKAGLEEAAKVCEEQYPYSVNHTDQRAAKNCAAAIRALKDAC